MHVRQQIIADNWSTEWHRLLPTTPITKCHCPPPPFPMMTAAVLRNVAWPPPPDK